MERKEQERNISIEQYLDNRIAGYVEIINKAQGAIEALSSLKENLVRSNGNEQKQEEEKADNGAGGE